MTAIFATVFFVISLIIGNLTAHKPESQWVDPTQGQVVEQVQTSDDLGLPVEENSNDIPQ